MDGYTERSRSVSSQACDRLCLGTSAPTEYVFVAMDWSSPSSSDTSCSPSCLGEKLHIDSEAESEVVDPATQPTATLGLPAAMPRNDTRGPVSGCPVRPTEPTRVAQLYPDYETIKSPSGILKSIRMAPSNMDMAVGQGTRVKCEPSSEPSYRISDRYRRGAVDKDLDNPERRMRRRELSQVCSQGIILLLQSEHTVCQSI